MLHWIFDQTGQKKQIHSGRYISFRKPGIKQKADGDYTTYMLEYGFLTLIVGDTVNAGLGTFKFVALQLDVFMQKLKAALPGSIAYQAPIIFTFFSYFVVLEE